MNIRRFLSTVAVLALVTTGVACSSKKEESKKDDNKKSEQADGKKNDTTNSTDEAPTSTVTNEQFTKEMKNLRSAIEGAGTDECKLVEALAVNPPMPANSDQVKEMIGAYVHMLNAVANIVGADTDNGKIIKESAAQMEKIAKDNGYKADLFESEEMAKILSDEKMSNAMMEFSSRASKCVGSTTGGGDTPASSEPAPGN